MYVIYFAIFSSVFNYYLQQVDLKNNVTIAKEKSVVFVELFRR